MLARKRTRWRGVEAVGCGSDQTFGLAVDRTARRTPRRRNGGQRGPHSTAARSPSVQCHGDTHVVSVQSFEAAVAGCRCVVLALARQRSGSRKEQMEKKAL
jgi:hypothetical protein